MNEEWLGVAWAGTEYVDNWMYSSSDALPQNSRDERDLIDALYIVSLLQVELQP